MIDISEKWVLLTGASRGIGKQVALALAQKGCRLILHSRSIVHTQGLAQELKRGGAAVHQVAAELSDQVQVRRLAEEALHFSGGVDILYNNAAVMTKFHEDIYIVSKEEYDLSFQVNTIAPITLCSMILPGMIQRRFGRIVNVTSGIKEQPRLMAYAASKAALDKYVYDMAPHLKGTGVLMNLLDPGWLRTDLGGPKAPNAVESVVPGALAPVLLDDDTCGKLFRAQEYRG
jgi:3-oxoacyl-[acyl-carrier protein] reductase